MIEIKEPNNALPMRPIFDLSNLSSREPSRTISIIPNVPSICKIIEKSGKSILK
ncbi:MAG: hypothetical protein ABIL76_05435 [candidate division WOR-3 bacterium]